MGSIIGHRIDYNGVEALRGQGHIPSKINPRTAPPLPPGSILGCEFLAFKCNNFQQQFKHFLKSVKNGDGCLLKGNLRRATELMRLLL